MIHFFVKSKPCWVFFIVFIFFLEERSFGCAHIIASQVETRKVIREHRGALPIEILTKEINGKKRVLILLGETHVKRKKSRIAAEALKDASYLRGFENCESENNHLTGKVLTRISGGIQFVSRNLLRLHDSSIGGDYKTIEDKKAFFKSSFGRPDVIAFVENFWKKNLTDVSTEDLLKSRITFEKEIILTGEEIVALLRSDESREVPSPAKYKLIDLEEGHKANIAAKVQHAGLMYMIFIQMPYVIAQGFFPEIRSETAIFLMAGFSLISFFEFTSHTFLHNTKLGEYSWFRALTAFSDRAALSRNKKMSENIEKALSVNSEAPEMLSITGWAHRIGIRKFLVKESEWKQISIDEYLASEP